MSKDGRWKEMPGLITDEMVDEWAIVCTADALAATVGQRCGDLYTTVLLDLPPSLRRDEHWVAETVAAVQATEHER
jgi:hypothetical protein